jgi:HlyD family secretion protein
MNRPLRHQHKQAQYLDEDTSGGQPARPARSRRWQRLAALLVLFAVGGAILGLWARHPAPPAPFVAAPAQVVALGRIEPAGRIVRLSSPGAPDSTRILALNVEEGDAVEAGQVLAVLDSRLRLEAQVNASLAQVALRKTQLERAIADGEAARRQRKAHRDRAQADLDQARADHERQLALTARAVGSAADLDQKKRALAVATAALEDAMASTDRILVTTPMEGQAEWLDVAVARREVQAAEASLAQDRASLADATLRAPFAGRVLAVSARPGERVGAAGLLDLAATDRMEALLDMDEGDLGRVRLGQEVAVRSNALADAAMGRVTRIGRVVRRQTVVNSDPAASTDARVVEIIVSFDAETSRVLGDLSRLQVTGRFIP